jgi:hypothetical protein
VAQRSVRPKPKAVPLLPFPAQPVAQADVPPARRLASTLGVMNPFPQVTDVLAAKERIGTVQFALDCRFFLSTWSASYVRLIELVPAVHTTIPVALAHCLWNAPSLPDYGPEEWLPNVSFQSRDASAVRQLVEHALSDMEQSGEAGNVLAQRLRTISFVEVSGIYELEGEPGGPRPAAPRHYGPTHQVMWQSNGRFFFLEIHNES